MKNRKAITILTVLIVLFSLIAAAAGIFPAEDRAGTCLPLFAGNPSCFTAEASIRTIRLPWLRRPSHRMS